VGRQGLTDGSSGWWGGWGEVLGEPVAEVGEEGATGGVFAPGAVAAVGELVVLEVWDVGEEAVADEGAGGGVVVAVEHEDGGADGGEGGGVGALCLEAEHVVPGFAVGAFVEGWCVGIGVVGDGVVVVERDDELDHGLEAGGGIGKISIQALDALSGGGVHAVVEGGLVAGACGGVEGAASDEDDWACVVGVFGGVGECEHCAPRFADECGWGGGGAGVDEVVEVGDVLGDGERSGAAAALEGFEDGEGVGERSGDGCDGAWGAGSAVEGDDKWAVCAVCVGSDGVGRVHGCQAGTSVKRRVQ